MPLEAADLSSAQFHPALGPNEPPIQFVLGAFCSEPKCRWVRSGPCAAISAQVKSERGAVRLEGRALSWYWNNSYRSHMYMHVCIHNVAFYRRHQLRVSQLYSDSEHKLEAQKRHINP